MAILPFSLTAVVSTTLLVYAVYLVGLVVYRLFFHPLANFPGPKFAAVSRWHEFYFDVVRKGQFTFVIEEWHQKYGPIIRIVPDELHIRDSQFFDTIYTRAGRVDKYEWTAGRFDSNMAGLTTSSAELHAIRRGALNPLFSRTRIIQLEETVRRKVDTLVDRVRAYRKNGRPFRLDRAFMAYSGDVIMRYCFGMDYDHLHSEDFATTLHESFMAASIQGALSTHFPIVVRTLKLFPEPWVEKVEPLYALLFKIRKDLAEQVVAAKKDHQEPKSYRPPTTVFQTLLDDQSLPIEEKHTARLTDEAQVVVGAGVTTTGWSLAVGAFHIINNPAIYTRLREELEHAIPNPDHLPSWRELERLPYLSGCIQESVRLSYPVTSRLQRLLPRPVTYHNWVIPARTPVSMTVNDISNDEAIFPEHDQFKPERWMNAPKTRDGSSLDRYFVCFQKGTRSCLGINLAYCEMYLIMAALYRKFTFRLYETDESDVALKHDFFLPSPKLDSKGVRVQCLPDTELDLGSITE